MIKKPVIAISVPNDKEKFEKECFEANEQGYAISSTHCYSYGENGQIDEIWMAIFVLPEPNCF